MGLRDNGNCPKKLDEEYAAPAGGRHRGPLHEGIEPWRLRLKISKDGSKRNKLGTYWISYYKWNIQYRTLHDRKLGQILCGLAKIIKYIDIRQRKRYGIAFSRLTT